jgi:hypothetical protein
MLSNLETFYNQKPGDKSNIALITHGNDVSNYEILAYPYKDPGADLEIISDDVEFCNAHLPEYDSNPQSAAQALLSKKSKYWWKAMITEFLNCEEKKVWVIVPKSKVPKGRKIIGNCWVYARKMMVLIEAVLFPRVSVKFLVKTFKNITLQLSMILPFVLY